jgi:phage-related minor tail protein
MASFAGAGKPALPFNPNMNLVPSITGGELGAEAERARLELEKLIAPAQQVASAAEGIGSAFANSFKGVVSGAMTAQEALASFFQSVADRFLDMAAQIIAKWIEMTILNSVLSLFPGGTMFKGAGPVSGTAAFSGEGMGAKGFLLPQLLPGRAAGGPVSAGSPYIVGERGPELFVPGRSGGIVPNDSLGMGSANVVVNVDASGSNVQGDGNQASQLGKAIGIAVQQELIKQKRPGGLLA